MSCYRQNKILRPWRLDTHMPEIPRWHRSYVGEEWSVVYLYRASRIDEKIDDVFSRGSNILWEYHYHGVQNGIRLGITHVDEAKRIIDERLVRDGFELVTPRQAVLL